MGCLCKMIDSMKDVINPQNRNSHVTHMSKFIFFLHSQRIGNLNFWTKWNVPKGQRGSSFGCKTSNKHCGEPTKSVCFSLSEQLQVFWSFDAVTLAEFFFLRKMFSFPLGASHQWGHFLWNIPATSRSVHQRHACSPGDDAVIASFFFFPSHFMLFVFPPPRHGEMRRWWHGRLKCLLFLFKMEMQVIKKTKRTSSPVPPPLSFLFLTPLLSLSSLLILFSPIAPFHPRLHLAPLA